MLYCVRHGILDFPSLFELTGLYSYSRTCTALYWLGTNVPDFFPLKISECTEGFVCWHELCWSRIRRAFFPSSYLSLRLVTSRLLLRLSWLWHLLEKRSPLSPATEASVLVPAMCFEKLEGMTRFMVWANLSFAMPGVYIVWWWWQWYMMLLFWSIFTAPYQLTVIARILH